MAFQKNSRLVAISRDILQGSHLSYKFTKKLTIKKNVMISLTVLERSAVET